LADIAVTQLLFFRLWQFAQCLGGPLAYRSHTSLICQGTLPDMPQTAAFGRFLYTPDPAVTARYANDCPIIAQIANTYLWIRGQVVAKSTGSGEPVFTSMDAILYGPQLCDGQFLNGKRVCDIS
jgi:hypothetical protein